MTSEDVDVQVPASWWQKVLRATEHLVHLRKLLAVYEMVDEYAVAESVEGKPKQFVYRAWIEPEGRIIDPMVPIVLGDFLSNLRAALDHLRAALVPRNRRSKGYFPIFTEDFRQRCDACGQQLKRHAEDAQRWNTYTTGMPQAAIDYLLGRQPFETGGDESLRADRHTLAVLNSLCNADKHRELIEPVVGLDFEHIEVRELDGTFVVQGKNPRGTSGEDGAVVYISDRKVDVKCRGAIAVTIRRGDDLYRLPGVCEQLLASVAGDILPSVETFIPE